MTAIDYINFAVAILTVGLGICGWIATRWTMDVLDMRAGPTHMAYTEVSAVSGCLFVGIGLGVLILNDPMAWTALGFAYGGAAVGRVTSILRDKAGTRQSWTFFASEAALAAWLLVANWPSAQA